ncbi:hypothetical protein ACF06Q_14635 [Streptomyces leeuwenhoekii]|uniref:hypothetical protein n=1 Tax=Streptomyces leeuwenhoekii TaxID=1437453 RepID=UPI0036FB3C4C
MLVLLLVLLVPGALARAQAAPGVVVSGESGAAAAEYDVPGTAPRVPARTGRRPAAPPRPAAVPRPRDGARRPVPAPPGPPPSCPRLPRSVVLRC